MINLFILSGFFLFISGWNVLCVASLIGSLLIHRLGVHGMIAEHFTSVLPASPKQLFLGNIHSGVQPLPCGTWSSWAQPSDLTNLPQLLIPYSCL